MPRKYQDRKQSIEALRPPRPSRQDRRREPDLLRRAHLAAVADLCPPDRDRPDPGLDRALRPVAVTHYPVTPIRHILPHGFGDQHLTKHPTDAFAGEFTQGIVDGVRLTQPDDTAISRHALLPGGFGRLSPASIRRLSQTVVTQIHA
jgi:hypothetical protein